MSEPSWQRHRTGCRRSSFRTLPQSQAYSRLRLHGGSLVMQIWLEKCGLIQRIPEARAGAVRQVEMMAATD